MRWLETFKSMNKAEHRTAWMLAMAADALQLAVFPLFVPGGASPADFVLDVIVGAMLTRILGWHWAFLPSFAAELVPGLDLFPTWTAAVFFVTRSRSGSSSTEPEILPPDPRTSR